MVRNVTAMPVGESDPKDVSGRIPSTPHQALRVDEARDQIFLAFGRDDAQDEQNDPLDWDNVEGTREHALNSCLELLDN